MVYGFRTLEKKYGIKVVEDYKKYNDTNNSYVQLYKMYSADGCPWENGLTRSGVKAECEVWGDALLEIKKANGGVAW